ncbi:MAG: DUF1214 domain-containing protein [Halieaceae bacterium]|nr:DUF1214 domain-containing protein [Halieaceae bacterium]
MRRFLSVLLVVVAATCGFVLGSLNTRKVITLPEAAWTGDSDAALAWREFTTSLEAAGARVFAATNDPLQRREGLEYLAQLAGASLEMKLAKGSESVPAFTDWMSDYRKFLGDTQDAVYHTAQLSPEFRYELSGNRGDADYLGFMLYGKQLNGWNRAAANLSIQDLSFDEAGNFTIQLSAEKPEAASANWLKLEDDIHMLMVRQYFHEREGSERARFVLRNLDAPAWAPATAVDTARGLRSATTFFNETVDGAIALADMMAQAPNSIDPPKSYSADFGGAFYPTFDNDYYGGWFRLEDDEALVIEGKVPDAPYWGVSLQNRWLQSMDYQHYQVGLNDQQIETEDGRYRIVVSHRKPPAGNWLDTAGHREGLLAIRYQLARDSEKPTLTLVKFSQL